MSVPFGNLNICTATGGQQIPPVATTIGAVGVNIMSSKTCARGVGAVYRMSAAIVLLHNLKP